MTMPPEPKAPALIFNVHTPKYVEYEQVAIMGCILRASRLLNLGFRPDATSSGKSVLTVQ
jgi:hypothetical protein